MNNETYYWLALSRIAGIGPKTGHNLLSIFPKLSDLFAAKTSTLEKLGISNELIQQIKNPPSQLIRQDLEWLAKPLHYFITYQDKLYPKLLKEIADPPLSLYVIGNPLSLSDVQIAIVGSRKPTYSGLDHAFAFAKVLAKNGLTIASGFAVGIDTKAHQGALAESGKTIAVFGTGIDIIYPQNNKNLINQIISCNGALVSELPLGSPAKAMNFPRRNRIISGLSLGVVVVEAAINSGSLITAHLAMEQGREVFALPGSIQNPFAKGCHALIREGAKLIESVDDIFEELFPIIKPLLNHPVSTESNNYSQEELASQQKKLLHYIGYEITPIDVIVERSGCSAQKISSQLLSLELKGFIKSVYGGYIKLGN